jgi:hypothetical protein
LLVQRVHPRAILGAHPQQIRGPLRLPRHGCLWWKRAVSRANHRRTTTKRGGGGHAMTLLPPPAVILLTEYFFYPKIFAT